MGKEFSITPRTVPRVETKYRRIVTALPHPDSVPTLEKLRQFEPFSMCGQPPIVWDRAEGFNILNHPNWGIPGEYPDFGPFFGKIFTCGDPRRMQFALRYDF